METFAETFSIPSGAKFLTLQMQDGAPTLWFQVDSSRSKQDRHFVVCATGGPLASDLMGYLGTFQKGWFVGHVYEVVNKAGE